MNKINEKKNSMGRNSRSYFSELFDQKTKQNKTFLEHGNNFDVLFSIPLIFLGTICTSLVQMTLC